MCQCPQRASSHFYKIYLEKDEHGECVNALNGLLAISTYIDGQSEVTMTECQCPQRASSHFYSYTNQENQRIYTVSMPSTGF